MSVPSQSICNVFTEAWGHNIRGDSCPDDLRPAHWSLGVQPLPPGPRGWQRGGLSVESPSHIKELLVLSAGCTVDVSTEEFKAGEI